MNAFCLSAGLLTMTLISLTPAQDPGAKPGIPDDKDPVTTASGLKVSVLKAGGEGPKPKLGDTVKVHYTGWLLDGTVFDSSRERGAPATFKLGQVVEGWNEGLTHATAGAVLKLTIPPALGYGERAMGKIPSNSTLVFEVELIELTPGPVMPTFKAADPAAQKATESGLKYEVIKEGEGECAKASDNCRVKYALFTTEGKLLDCTEMSNRPLTGTPDQQMLKFMKEAIPLLKPGARYRFEVPPALCFGDQARGPIAANSTTVWELELESVVRPMTVPEFKMPGDDELKTTASGLKYKVVKEGAGSTPHMGENVTVHYAGWLTDGKLFDTSYSRGEPATFRLGQVIPGWNEGLQLMKEGAVYVFVIPPDLAYKDQGMPPTIPPKATLVFQVELISAAHGH